MKPAEDFHRISETLCVWQVYDPGVKVECTSTAIRTDAGWVLIDPISLEETALYQLLGGAGCAAIILTSGNHQRASTDFRKRLSVKVMAPLEARAALDADEWFSEGETVMGLRSLPLQGGASGETAFFTGDTVIVGDALIHLGDLMILPDKYCESPKLLRESLAELAKEEFATLCFAHGLPILSLARERVAALL